MDKLRKNNAITLIALVITIIVMLILVAVTIALSINGGLFQYAGDATRRTNEAIHQEKTLGDVPENLSAQGLIDYYTNDGRAYEYGYIASENIFVGQRSIGKFEEGVEDNTQKTNWDSSKNGYVFTEGHFIDAGEQTYYDPETNSNKWAHVYFCWDNGTYNNVNDFLMTYGDWFDIYSPEGVFLDHTIITAVFN